MGSPGASREGGGWRSVLVALALFLAGCASGVQPQAMQSGNGLILSFQPTSLGRPLDLSQLVVGSYGEKQYKMRFEVNITGNRLVVVGLSEFGMTLFTIVQDGENVEVESPGQQKVPIDPTYLLSDFYLVQWPAEKLAAAYAERGLRFEALPKARSRQVRDADGTIMVEVEYPVPGERSEIWVRHYDHPYTLRILTLEQRPTR